MADGIGITQADLNFDFEFDLATLTTDFRGAFDFFGQYAVSDTNNSARGRFQSGWDGSFGIMGLPHDAEGGSATRSVTLYGIDVTGFGGLSVGLSLGASSSERFENFEASDGIRIRTVTDSGPFSLLAAFLTASGSANLLLLDTDNDGFGDGAELSFALSDHFFAPSGTGNSLDIIVDMSSTEAFESLASDNVNVTGDVLPAVPLPASLQRLAACLF